MRFIAAIVLALLTATPSPPLRPDPVLTPGAVLTDDEDTVCERGYAGSVRAVSAATKRAVFAEYHIAPSGDYEIDHLISLELGGSNDPANLWPESYHAQPWNAHIKDRLENYLHRAVCRHDMSLRAAQHLISSDWIAAYTQLIGDPPS